MDRERSLKRGVASLKDEKAKAEVRSRRRSRRDLIGRVRSGRPRRLTSAHISAQAALADAHIATVRASSDAAAGAARCCCLAAVVVARPCHCVASTWRTHLPHLAGAAARKALAQISAERDAAAKAAREAIEALTALQVRRTQ